MKPSTVMLCCVLYCCPLAAQAELIDIAWDASGGFAQQRDVPAGKFVEVCGKLAAGLKVQWTFEATAPIDFNIHFHAGKDVIYPAKRAQVSTGHDTLHVKTAQDYCWMWTNKTAAVARLKMSLQRSE